MSTHDLSGTWQGHYWQGGGRHAISMQIVQRGQSFVGRMVDSDTVLASRETLRTQPAGKGDVLAEVEVMSTLPEQSTIEGEIEGRLVQFTKHYQGKSSASVWVADSKTRTYEFPGHRVLYDGALSGDGEEIVGHWQIAAQTPEGAAQRDRFLLRRRR
jgi:hypothetical protein